MQVNFQVLGGHEGCAPLESSNYTPLATPGLWQVCSIWRWYGVERHALKLAAPGGLVSDLCTPNARVCIRHTPKASQPMLTTPWLWRCFGETSTLFYRSILAAKRAQPRWNRRGLFAAGQVPSSPGDTQFKYLKACVTVTRDHLCVYVVGHQVAPGA